MIRRPLFQRGVLFSLLGLLISAFFILLFWFSNAPRLDTTSSAVDTRVSVLDAYIASWDSFVVDATYLSTRLLLKSFTENISQGSPAMLLNDTKTTLSGCILNGTGSCGTLFVKNASLLTQLNEFVLLGAQEIGLNTTFILSGNITVSDWAPFQVLVEFQLNYTVIDPIFAKWDRSELYSVVVSVEGLPDPLFERYGVAALIAGFENRTIEEFAIPRSLLTMGGVQGVIATKQYVANPRVSPTYLQRLAGIVTGPLDPDDVAGIETLLDPNDVRASWINPLEWENASFTAHQVFAQELFVCGNETARINGFTPPQFSLDLVHLPRYNFNDTLSLDFTCP